MPWSTARVFQRSSAIRQADKQVLHEAKAIAPTINQRGADLLREILLEESKQLSALWDREETDAKETANGIMPVMPASKKDAIEKTFAELEETPSRDARKLSAIIRENRAAKAELAELAKKN